MNIKQRLLDYKNLSSKDYKLIYFFLNYIFKENSFYYEKKYTDREINKEIYERIDGKFSEMEIEGGEVLDKICRLFKNTQGSVHEYSEIEKMIDLSPGKTALVLTILANEELLIRIVENKKSYYSISDFFDKRLEAICSKINNYIRAYNLMPYSSGDIEIDEYEENVEIKGKVDELTKKYRIPDKEFDSSEILSDKNKLLEYMKNIIEIESEIYSLESRFNSLKYLKSYNIEMHLLIDSFSICLSQVEKIEKIDSEICEINSTFVEKPTLEYFINKNNVAKPEFIKTKPAEPTLKTPGLFNKKKVEQENEELLFNYNSELEKYEKAKEEYKTLLNKYEIESENAKEEAKKQFEQALQKYQERIDNNKAILDNKIMQKEEFINDSENKIKELLMENTYYKKVKSIEYEMEYIYKCLEEPIRLKQELYSYNIIYGKYRNFIAVSSFVDYFMSGRCDCLDGGNGAYNLYEQESRTDIIINKMDVIISKLDQIAENQYYIYNKLTEINETLKDISNLLLVNDLIQVVQVAELQKIEEKTNEIAYNTKVTSFYAEKTAKYAKIMTYLTALSMN